MFEYHIHVYSPGAGADNPLRPNFRFVNFVCFKRKIFAIYSDLGSLENVFSAVLNSVRFSFRYFNIHRYKH